MPVVDISEAETGSMKLSLQRVSVPALIQDSVELYRYIAEAKNIQITTKYPDHLSLRADWNRMRQVLANLLDNAIKYTDSGGQVQVEAFRISDETVILIKDTRIGIASDLIGIGIDCL